jgi:hypothetical protein
MQQIILHIMILLTATSVIAAELPDKCRQVPVKGSCKAMIEKYYFNQNTKKCTAYFLDGCGPIVPFDALTDCQSECEKVTTPKKWGLNRDPVESDPRYSEVFKNIDAEVDQALSQHPLKGRMGFCYTIWETKKRILKKKYQIDWQTPAELNPQVMFD